MLGLFIMTLFEQPRQFFAVLISVVISIVLHELAHGWMAMRHGDMTPLHSGHMTLNPMVHMGPMSLVLLLVAGIAWGAMPIDPSRLRGRWAAAKVALAGPATNLLLGLAGLTAVGLWKRWGGGPVEQQGPMANVFVLLLTFGWINVALCLFNLLPVPPLDGAHILADLHGGYRRLLSNPANQGLMTLMFLMLFVFAAGIFDLAGTLAAWYVRLLAG